MNIAGTDHWQKNHLFAFKLHGKWRESIKRVGKVTFHYEVDMDNNRLWMSVSKGISSSLSTPTPFVVEETFIGYMR